MARRSRSSPGSAPAPSPPIRPGNEIYFGAARVTRSFAVTKADQTITFGALPDVATRRADHRRRATASSGLAVVVLRHDAERLHRERDDDHTARRRYVHGRRPTSRATASTTPRPRSSQSFGVGRIRSVDHVRRSGRRDRDARADHGDRDRVVGSRPSRSPRQHRSVCTAGGANGATITIVTAGICTVQADQPGDDTYAAAAAATRSFAVTKVAQTITFGSLAGIASSARADHPRGDRVVATSRSRSRALPRLCARPAGPTARR